MQLAFTICRPSSWLWPQHKNTQLAAAYGMQYSHRDQGRIRSSDEIIVVGGGDSVSWLRTVCDTRPQSQFHASTRWLQSAYMQSPAHLRCSLFHTD
jgi:hypothetical protein